MGIDDQPETARILVWHGGHSFEVRTVPLPTPGPGEILARVDLSAVCGSDLHTVAGHRSSPHPGVLGHEAVGHVVAVGDGVPRAAVGDRITWGVVASCHDCSRCTAGHTAKCIHRMKTGHEPLDSPWGPLSGSYASHLLIPQGLAIAPVPQHVPDGPAAIAACALATVMACRETAGGFAGKRLLVTGAGMLGICAVAIAFADGARSITITDIASDRLATATAFGAHHAITAPRSDPNQLPAGPVDVAIELCGAATAHDLCVTALDVGGIAVFAGAARPSDPVAIDPERLIRQQQRVAGVHNYEPHHLQEAVDFLATSGTTWDGIFAPAIPLDDLPALLTAPPSEPLRHTVTAW